MRRWLRRLRQRWKFSPIKDFEFVRGDLKDLGVAEKAVRLGCRELLRSMKETCESV